MKISLLHPQRHEPPSGWPPETFETLTDAIAGALVAAMKRQAERGRQGAEAAR
ncbi:MAG: hypothetical protein ACREKJ_03195 [Candidatus Rokuibacteriota bacterium]